MSGIDRAFAYEIPARLYGEIAPGSVVRVVLNGRRVRGWVLEALSELPDGVELRELGELVSLGPPPGVVDLARWAAWRYAGRLRPLLVAASPPRLVRALPAAPPVPERAPARPLGEASLQAEITAATLQALSSPAAVLRLPPAAPRLAVVQAAIDAFADRAGDLLVLAATSRDAATLAGRLERLGHRVALQPEAWAAAAAGGRVVVGTRSAVLAPVPGLSGLVVLDAHADSYQEERVPTWEAVVLAGERARREHVPCLLVSPCPTVAMLAGRSLVTLSRASERAGWAPLELVDAGDEDPRAGGYPARLAAVIRSAAEAEPERPVVAVLNRRGRARLLACGRCRALLRCEACGAPLVQLEGAAAVQGAVLSCRRCDSEAPACCRSCGPTRARIVRPGVSRAREDLEALTGLRVAEVAGAKSAGAKSAGARAAGARAAGAKEAGEALPDAPVLVGTEAVLHRAGSASVVVFLDFDNELLAPRYRAGEQALSLLALASRLVGGRRRQGRVVVRTRLLDHEVLAAATSADPGRLVSVEAPRRRLLRLPPETALALVSGQGAPDYVARLSQLDPAPEVGGPAGDRFLVRAGGPDVLADALAAAGPPGPGTRVEVAPGAV